jgi:hypothetical protein
MKVRFSLRVLILLLTVTGLILGLYQWKVVSAQREVIALEKLGVVFSVQTGLFGVPIYADIPIGSAEQVEIRRRLEMLGLKPHNIGSTSSDWQEVF